METFAVLLVCGDRMAQGFLFKEECFALLAGRQFVPTVWLPEGTADYLGVPTNERTGLTVLLDLLDPEVRSALQKAGR